MIKKILFGNSIRAFISIYAIVTTIGALLLMLPTSLLDGASLSFIDALFVSVSGISTTGLSTINVSETFSTSGQVILAMILQFGGIGLIMFIGIIWMAVGKKLSFKERSMIMQDQNQVTMQGVVKLLKNVLLILFVIEFTAIITLGTYFYLSGNGDGFSSFGESYYNAFFLVISLITNAGFDITGNSLMHYHNDYFVQSISMFLMFVGAVGFWPLIEVKEFIKSKFKREKFKFTIFSKVLIFTHIALWLIGAFIMFGVEKSAGNFLENKGIAESIYYSLFMSISTRNAGFATVNMADLSEGTHMLFNVLMFLGSSPNSAGGGIRSTTLVVIVLSMYSFARGRNQVVIFKRSIKNQSVIKAFTIFTGAMTLVIMSTIIMLIFEHDITLSEALFEVTSAFGTTGLSLGITGDIGNFSKVILILNMFIGRIGIITLFMLIRDKGDRNSIKYPEIDLIIG